MLHQGLYLGFGALRAISSPAIHALWHDPTVSSIAFDESGAPSGNTTESLFNLGSLLIAAGREVAFVGATGGAAPLAGSSKWAFFLANGPGAAHHAYLRSLNLMVRGRGLLHSGSYCLSATSHSRLQG